MNHIEDNMTSYLSAIIKEKPLSDTYLSKILKSQQEDEICSKLKEYTVKGWPDKKNLPSNLTNYYEYRYDFSMFNDLLLKDIRIVIPKELHHEVLNFIHLGHQGIVKCKRRANSSVWWVGLNKQIEQLVTDCNICIEHRTIPKEPFHFDDFPERPWEKIAADLFKSKRNCKWYLIVTDYFSRFFEIFELKSSTEDVIICHIKTLFSRYGRCDIIRTDGGPQFQSKFRRFAKDYNFKHITSSP